MIVCDRVPCSIPQFKHKAIYIYGSPHVHGLAWLPGAPDVQLFTDPAVAEENHQQAIAFIDVTLYSIFPASVCVTNKPPFILFVP